VLDEGEFRIASQDYGLQTASGSNYKGISV
jgi:hypothetical protein